MTPPFSDTEIEANAPLLAVAVLQHPIALQFASTAVNALAIIATGAASCTPDARCLLRRALFAIDLAEVEISRRLA